MLLQFFFRWRCKGFFGGLRTQRHPYMPLVSTRMKQLIKINNWIQTMLTLSSIRKWVKYTGKWKTKLNCGGRKFTQQRKTYWDLGDVQKLRLENQSENTTMFPRKQTHRNEFCLPKWSRALQISGALITSYYHCTSIDSGLLECYSPSHEHHKAQVCGCTHGFIYTRVQDTRDACALLFLVINL